MKWTKTPPTEPCWCWVRLPWLGEWCLPKVHFFEKDGISDYGMDIECLVQEGAEFCVIPRPEEP